MDPLNLPAPGRRQCIYGDLRLGMHLCFGKQSLPPGLCHPQPPTTRKGPARPGVSLMPKAREQFAEFLDQDSLDRFGILYQTTCVGLGYGRQRTSRRSFSRPTGSPDITP